MSCHVRFRRALVAVALVACSCRPAAEPGEAARPAPEPSISPAPEAPSAAPAVAASAPPARPTTCALGAYAEWRACAGEVVEIRGHRPKFVSAHPMLAGPRRPGEPGLHQGYLDVPDVTQMIVLTRDPIACPGAMRVTGTLREVSLGGPPGTKSSYGGWALEDASAECE